MRFVAHAAKSEKISVKLEELQGDCLTSYFIGAFVAYIAVVDFAASRVSVSSRKIWKLSISHTLVLLEKRTEAREFRTG